MEINSRKQKVWESIPDDAKVITFKAPKRRDPVVVRLRPTSRKALNGRGPSSSYSTSNRSPSGSVHPSYFSASPSLVKTLRANKRPKFSLLKKHHSRKRTDTVSSRPVGQTIGDTIAWQFVSISSSQDVITVDFRVNDLGDDVLVGETDNHTIFRRVVLVFGLNYETFTCIVVGLSLYNELSKTYSKSSRQKSQQCSQKGSNVLHQIGAKD